MIKIIIGLVAFLFAIYIMLPRPTEIITENTGTITLPTIEITVIPTIEPTPTPTPFISTINYEEKIKAVFEAGTLYEVDDGYIYLPTEINENTSIIIYYPGYEGHPVIQYFYWQIENYFKHFSPNAIMFFSEGSGYRNMDERNPEILKHIRQIRGQYEIDGELIVCGSSLGSYAAMHLADQDEEVVSKVLCLDCGYDYSVPCLLDDEQIEKIAAIGTEFYLFEQIGIDNTRFNFIQRLIDGGIKTYIVECANGSHDAITENAFDYDVFSWAIGDEELSEIQYTLKELNIL